MNQTELATKEQVKAFMQEHDGIKIEGAGLQESVYTHVTMGSFATDRINAVVASLPRQMRDVITRRVLITEDMRTGVKNADVSRDRIDKMPLEMARSMPVLFLEMADGTHILGDGNHRATKLIEAGDQVIMGYMIPNSVVEKFRVRVLARNRHTGVYEPIPPEIDLALMQGDFKHHEWY